MTALARLRDAMQKAECEALLLTEMTNIRWLTGFTGSFGLVAVTQDDARFLTDSRYTIQSAEQVQCMSTHSFARPTTVHEFLVQQLGEMNLSQLNFDQGHVSVGQWQDWQKKVPGVEFVPIADPCEQLRMCKDAAEVERIVAACQLADDCMKHVIEHIRVGVTERELLRVLQNFLFDHGSVPSFDPIIVSGERSARPHGTPSDKKIEHGDFVTLDLGAVVDGYCSDITRTVVVGSASDRHRQVYEAVLETENACIDACKAGENGRELDQLARSVLRKHEVEQYFTHGLGHGLGILVHDPGRLSSTQDQPIEVGQVWTIEPGVYIEGLGGVRIEDDILVTEGDARVLTHHPKELLEVG